MSDRWEKDVFICFDEDEKHEDHKIAKKFNDELTNQGLTCFFGTEDFHPGLPMSENIATGIKSSNKLLLLVSRNWVKTDYYRLERECGLVKDHRRVNNLYVVIDETFGFDDPEFPKAIAGETWTRDIGPYCAKKNDNAAYWKRLCEDIRREDQIATCAPWGDIAHGICWTYYYGYLNIILPGLEKDVEKWRETPEFQSDHVVKQLLIISPKQDVDKSLGSYNNIEQVDCIPRQEHRAGHSRNYDHVMCRVTSTRNNEVESYIVVATFNWSLLAIKKVKEDAFFGLPERHLHVQQRICVDKLRRVINMNGYGARAQIIEFEGDEDNLADLMVDKCRQAWAAQEGRAQEGGAQEGGAQGGGEPMEH